MLQDTSVGNTAQSGFLIGDKDSFMMHKRGTLHCSSPQHEVPVLSVPEAPAVVLHHLHAEPAELVVQEHVHQVELHHQADEVQGLA